MHLPLALVTHTTQVGKVVATTPSHELLLSIVAGNDLGIFKIDPCGGIITVAAAVLDYENNALNNFNLTVTAIADNNPLAASNATVLILVTNVNEPPQFVSAVWAGAIHEISPPAATVSNGTGVPPPPVSGTPWLLLRAVDPENDPANWTITFGDNAHAFVLVPQPGALSALLRLGPAVASDGTAPLNHEAALLLTLTVFISDPHTIQLSDTATVALNVLDDNEPPVVALWQAFTVDEVSGRVVTYVYKSNHTAGECVCVRGCGYAGHCCVVLNTLLQCTRAS